MHRFRARLKKLEGIAPATANWNYGDVQECARKMLSAEDRDLLDQAIALFKIDSWRNNWTEAHHAVWKRWDEMLLKATREVHFPIYFCADDTSF